VDIDAGDALVQRIKPLSRGTQRPGVIRTFIQFYSDSDYVDFKNLMKTY